MKVFPQCKVIEEDNTRYKKITIRDKVEVTVKWKDAFV